MYYIVYLSVAFICRIIGHILYIHIHIYAYTDYALLEHFRNLPAFVKL